MAMKKKNKTTRMEKKLRSKFYLKYIFLGMMFAVIPLYLLVFFIQNLFVWFLPIIDLVVAFILLGVWLHLFDFGFVSDKREIYAFFSKIDLNRRFGRKFYEDTVLWFWWDIKKICYAQNPDAEYDKLRWFLLDEDSSIAITEKERFQKLCERLKDIQEPEKRSEEIINEFKSPTFVSSSSEILKTRRFRRFPDKTVMIYVLIIVLHISACFLSGIEHFKDISNLKGKFHLKNAVENLLFYLPLDFVPLLLYFNVIKDKEVETGRKKELL